MSELQNRIAELSSLIEEFGLESADWKGEDWRVEFGPAPQAIMMAPAAASGPAVPAPAPKRTAPAAPTGRPICSPMTGIFYAAPSPGSPNFVKPGQVIQAGEVIGLIEAMKVFNEVTSTMSGKVVAVKAESGQLVQPGDALVVLE